MRIGVRLGIDVGKARVGVAKSDAHGMLATPLETVKRDHEGSKDIDRIIDYANEYEAIEIIIGLPLNLRGERTASTDDAVDFAEMISTRFSPVRLVDERLSTVSAWDQLHLVGKNQKNGRGVIDQVAAVIILQQALDNERNVGKPAGTLVETPKNTQTPSNGEPHS